MQIIENENGTFKLTATNEMENRLINSICDLVFASTGNGETDEAIANDHGCNIEGENAFNYVTVPEAAIFAEQFEIV